MDYHIVTLGRLHILTEWLKARGAGVAHAWVDDGPVPERELAQRAGLGWIGKNTMLLNPPISRSTRHSTLTCAAPVGAAWTPVQPTRSSTSACLTRTDAFRT
jgi:epoxyqueuosine reductase